jgi:surface protein
MLITVDTTSNGCSGTSVDLPLFGTVNASIDWGDGHNSIVTTPGDVDHVYSNPGTYQISIDGAGSVSQFGDASGSANECAITDVSDWGSFAISNLSYAFYDDSNLISLPSYLPSGVLNTSFMLAGATSFNQNVSFWDTSSVTNMTGMFENDTAFDNGGVTLSSPVGGWNTSLVNNMTSMFQGDRNFSQDVSTWNTSSLQYAQYLFQGDATFNESLSNWQMENVINATSMLDGTAVSVANYDASLNSWDQQSLQNAVPFGASGVQFDSSGAAARADLVGPNNSWVISDAGEYGVSATTALVPQSPLTLQSQGSPSTGYTLSAQGGSGTGSVAYAISNGTATGCSLIGNVASAATSGSCVVIATKSSDTSYAPLSSTPLTLIFTVSSSAAAPASSSMGSVHKVATISFASATTISAANLKVLSTYARLLPKGASVVVNVHVKGANSASALAEVALVKKYLLSKDSHLKITVGTVSNSKTNSVTIQEV